MGGDAPLRSPVRERISDPQHAVFVSAATIWEIGIKQRKGKLRIAEDVTPFVDLSGFKRLDVTFEHAVAAGELPLHHRDPFDRMLIAQARVEGLTLATADSKIARYDVPVLDVTRD